MAWEAERGLDFSAYSSFQPVPLTFRKGMRGEEPRPECMGCVGCSGTSAMVLLGRRQSLRKLEGSEGPSEGWGGRLQAELQAWP